MEEHYDAISSNTQQLSIFDLEIFPNPAFEEVQLSWDDPTTYDIELINIQGQVSKRMSEVSSGTPLNIGELNAGNYFLRFIDSQGSYLVRKIVKL